MPLNPDSITFLILTAPSGVYGALPTDSAAVTSFVDGSLLNDIMGTTTSRRRRSIFDDDDVVVTYIGRR